MNKLYSVIFLLIIPFLISAQETIIPVGGNPVSDKTSRMDSKKSETGDTLEIPFIDDFSDRYISPDPGKWSDMDAFINNTYPLNPVTAGVATLDAYQADGSHYPNAGSIPYKADYLTSQPINLDYNPPENIYLSFYFQAGGLGEMPENKDSLILEFFDPVNEQWNKIWAVNGDKTSTEFEWVILPILEQNYLEKGFKFRFSNLASQTSSKDFPDKLSNVDHWHIDYVKIDRDRSPSDSILRDVSFVKPLSSILKDYSSLPWTHFESAFFTQREPFIEVEISNMDTVTRNVTKSLVITDLFNNNTYSPVPTASDIPPGTRFISNYEYDYPFVFDAGDSALFEIKTILRTDVIDYKPNDTLTYLQVFNNYYSYDDGTVEAGYGLRGQGTQNASVAVKITPFMEDSLRAVDMYFNQVIDSVNLDYYFYLEVWDDNNGKPGNLLYSQLGMRPAYSNLNEPVRYYLDSVISVTDVFYVGWTKTVDKILNIGLDLNTNNANNNYYTSGSGWINSTIPATIMIRPVLSRQPLIMTTAETEEPDEAMFTVYPNPARDQVRLNIPGNPGMISFALYDITGKQIRTGEIDSSYPLSLEGLKEGIYFIRVQDNRTTDVYSSKVIIRQ